MQQREKPKLKPLLVTFGLLKIMSHYMIKHLPSQEENLFFYTVEYFRFEFFQ